MRKCNCSGNCGPEPLNRRQFIGLVGAGAAAALVGTPAWGAFELPPDELERWRKELFAPAKPRLYSSAKHTDARMHLGGIGTGNFEIGADGQFTTWQLFNTLRDGHVPLHFLVKAGGAAKLLQTAGGPNWPRVSGIEMTGEYPFAGLSFRDAELPVQLELSAFSPFAPLDARFSSMPLAAFLFKITNPTQQQQTVSLAALMQNPVGYDAAGGNDAGTNPCFGGNVNDVVHDGQAGGLFMRAEAAGQAALDQPVTLFAAGNLKGLNAPPHDRPPELRLEVLDGKPVPAQKLADPAHTVIWMEEPPATTTAAFLRGAEDAVQAGAALVFSGKTMPLLEAYIGWARGKSVSAAQPRPDIVFEDFEHGYENWKVQGEAFGKEPARGTLPNQNPVSGFIGHGLVDSYFGGDDMTGRLVSKPFTIERQFIRFLIGGGHHANTQMRLVVDGKVVLAASGKNDERLESALWPVGAFEGKSAHIEIVDEQKGGWGHINVDEIVFSDTPGDATVMTLLEELIPAEYSSTRPASKGASAETGAQAPQVMTRNIGKGKVVVVAGPVLDPAHAELSHQRQRAYAFLCSLAGARYTASAKLHPKAPGFGTLALAALGGEITVLPAAEHREEVWKAFVRDGRFTGVAQVSKPAVSPTSKSADRTSGGDPSHREASAGLETRATPVTSALPTPSGRTVYGAVATTVQVPAGKTVEVPFLLAWHYPNKYNAHGTWMGCHYATQWADARAVLREAAASFTELKRRTESFRTALYDSTLPWWLLDCLTANAAIARHVGVVFRIANGDAYGWEGSNGCCQPTCTHVWGYEQTFARLFPTLEKEMRRIDFKHQQGEDGGINNRTEVPSPPHPTSEHPFADGHASCILKAWREALNHPGDGFLKEYWPHVKRAVEYLIARDAKGSGGEPGGVLQDDQWNTYDEALHGVTTFISGYYLAALRAGEEWARRMGDTATAERFRDIFQKGQAKLVELCWNGEYFQQHLPDYLSRPGEFGPGCMADQLIGQWWAHQLGLGYILPKDMVVSALRAIYKHNFKTDLTGWQHAPRAFAGVKDKGLIICTWPKGGRPANVLLYSDEVWTGAEYQVAAHMLYEGLIEEGFAIVKGARDRYDGAPRPPIGRNPWNEIECGGHYARAMSSWSLLLALSGWEYDGPRWAVRFTPRHTPERFQSFFAGPEGWGSLRQSRQGQTQENELSVREGWLSVAEVTLAVNTRLKAVTAQCGGRTVPSKFYGSEGRVRVLFAPPVTIQSGQSLLLRLG